MALIEQPADGARRERVLAAALEVFGRYGFRKTSMDEVARAAEISRQGLYLHFANKEALFRAAVRRELETALSEVSDRLSEEGAPLETRVVLALDAWLGRFVGTTLAVDVGNLLENSAMQLGDMVAEYTAAFDARIAAEVADVTSASDRRRLGTTPEEIAATLQTLARGWKYQVGSRAEFVSKMESGVRLVFAGLPTTRKECQ